MTQMAQISNILDISRRNREKVSCFQIAVGGYFKQLLWVIFLPTFEESGIRIVSNFRIFEKYSYSICELVED